MPAILPALAQKRCDTNIGALHSEHTRPVTSPPGVDSVRAVARPAVASASRAATLIICRA